MRKQVEIRNNNGTPANPTEVAEIFTAQRRAHKLEMTGDEYMRQGDNEYAPHNNPPVFEVEISEAERQDISRVGWTRITGKHTASI